MYHKQHSNPIPMIALGAALAGAVAAAVYFLGPDGKKHQKDSRDWADSMKRNILRKIEDASDVTESVYHDIIDSIAAQYEKNAKAGKKEVRSLAEDLKKHWKVIRSS